MNESTDRATRSAAVIAKCWREASKCTDLDPAFRPQTLLEGYQAQAKLAQLMSDEVVGYKLAATALTGQRHLQVDEPVIGRLLSSRVVQTDANIAMQGNRMRVAECEFVFKLGRDLPPRDKHYSVDEVSAAIDSLHPGLEFPDSRFADFVTAGAAQLAADNACTHWMVIGAATDQPWRDTDLTTHKTSLVINNSVVTRGQGADVLDSPLLALTWLANQHAMLGEGLTAGQFVTTGVTGLPCPITEGDLVCADLGIFGSVSAQL